MLNEFKEFAVKGNVIDMAVGIIIGGAFSTIVRDLVDGILMPPLGLITGNLDFTNQFWVISEGDTAGPYNTVDQAEQAGAVVITYGQLINSIIAFLLVAFALFLLIRWINNLKRSHTDPAPSTRTCPFCKSSIDEDASRCPQCTSEVKPVGTPKADAHPTSLP